ncbi:hypothetical protein [Pararhodobacter sp. SW119]|uniref:spike base protein, RCAP_Rcc01079 family n=1 Tax=Pararhodobacter sp. SW119 TaxID=2780075 RepID=UPI001AE0C53B|nr:hypothetical protein [Pararhodobacter sp. SW119]
MQDDFRRHETSLTAPAERAEAIVPSDSAELPRATRAIYVGGAGDLRVRMISGEAVTFAGMQAGMSYPLRLRQVLATGTTATGLVGLS